MKSARSLYQSVFTPENCKGHFLYVHGGPGNNSALFEAFVRETQEYSSFDYGWIFYDQRGCGQSPQTSEDELSHTANVSDLNEMISYCGEQVTSNLVGIVGHSYGARLVHDVMIQHNPPVLPIMVGVASSFKTARKKSLIMDLLNLKFNQPEEYLDIVDSIDQHDDEIWRNAKSVRSKMKHIDKRKLFYWGNLAALEKVEKIKRKLNIEETNEKTFSIVRKDLHGNPDNYIGPCPNKIKTKYLWINGLHDFLMAGELLDYENKGITTFYKSGHYPHMEETQRFLKELKGFIEGDND
jgi:proline iminopeptidase